MPIGRGVNALPRQLCAAQAAEIRSGMARTSPFARAVGPAGEGGLPQIMAWGVSFLCLLGCFQSVSVEFLKPVRNRRDDNFAHPCRHRSPADARCAAALGRRRNLHAVPARREPAADRPRHDVADHRWPVDYRPSRGARDRCLFLYHARPALDLHPVAGAGAVREGLCDRGLGRTGGTHCYRDRCDLRFARPCPEPSPEREHDAGVDRIRACAHRAASSGAAARLALPIMVAWVAGLIAAADAREAPSFRLLPLMALWANLHGGFVFGLVLVFPIALDAVLGAEAASRHQLILRWGAIVAASFVAACCTPYGWNALLAAQRILSLGSALPLIMEWKPADFSSLSPLELFLLSGIALALYRGVRLPPLRIALLLGLLHMALAQGRAAENLALVAPIVLAAPLARQISGSDISTSLTPPARGMLIASVTTLLIAGTLAYASVHRFAPHMRGSPVQAVAELKKLDVSRVFNDYDFGGYLIANGVAPFIDGRTELYGEKFFVDHNAASGLMEPDNLFRLLDAYKCEATLMRTQSAATKLLDRVDGWKKVYADDIATIHVRAAGAVHTVDPAVEPGSRF